MNFLLTESIVLAKKDALYGIINVSLQLVKIQEQLVAARGEFEQTMRKLKVSVSIVLYGRLLVITMTTIPSYSTSHTGERLIPLRE